MSLPIIIIIMLLAGIAGGYINYLLPSNMNADGTKIRKVLACLVLGIGATILIPLFLEIAQSKLMDNIHYSWALQKSECDCNKSKTDTVTVQLTKTGTAIIDTTITSIQKKDTLAGKVVTTNKVSDIANCCVPVKNYFLFAAYCFLAAAAGFRFINNLIDSVLKDKQIADLKEKNVKTEAEKEQEKKAKEKLDAQNKLEASIEEKTAFQEVSQRAAEFVTPVPVKMPVLGPITHPDDPQKGRFGGKDEYNGRALKATVQASNERPGYFNVTIWVESTDSDRPLHNDVIFYLHDSFRPSVYSIKPDEFKDGKAIDDEIISYGAFTVGIVTDNGQTLLELDLSEDKKFPKEFRER